MDRNSPSTRSEESSASIAGDAAVVEDVDAAVAVVEDDVVAAFAFPGKTIWNWPTELLMLLSLFWNFFRPPERRWIG